MKPADLSHDGAVANGERARLSISIQTSSLREAMKLVAAFGSTGAEVAHVHPPQLRPLGRSDWIVALTTPPVPLTAAAIRRWEDEMCAVERRCPGSRFLGWRTYEAQLPPEDAAEAAPENDGPSEPARRSQRELVIASLLRQPPGRRGGSGRDRGVKR